MRLPNYPVLEKGIIHGVLTDPTWMTEPEVLTLKPEHFMNTALGAIWEFIHVAYREHKTTGYHLLFPYEKHPRWPRDLPVAKLIDFSEYSINFLAFRAAVGEVQKAWVQRELQRELQQSIREISESTDPSVVMSNLQSKFEVLRSVQGSSKIVTVGDALQGSVERLSAKISVNGVSTGFRCLDERNFYFQNQTLSIVCGRPGMGKSTILTQFAQNATLAGHRAQLFSFEDGEEDTADRSLIRMSQIPRKTFQMGLVDHTQKRVDIARERLAGLPYYLNETDRLIDRLIAECHRKVKQQGVDLILIDQLSHLKVLKYPPGVENRNHLYGYFCSQLIHEVAKPLNVPVVLASQLKRTEVVTDRETGFKVGKEPSLEDLRDSGEVENYAYRVLGAHRPEYYDRRNRSGEADLLLLKNKNGPVDTVTVAANMELYTFSEGSLL